MYEFNMLVFAVETSCDETSVSIMQSDRAILSHKIYSQEIHKKYGGVVPELASRTHLEILQKITKESFEEAKLKPTEIDVYTATCGPGLIGSLLVGSIFAKSLSIGANKPFLPINHLEGHVLSTSYNNDIKFPHIVYLLTGGHTQIYLMKSKNDINLIGETVDDAVGEAFDKVAKLLGLPYPGGAEIEKKAKNGNENEFQLPKPFSKDKNFNFSFSGLKTFVNMIVKKNTISEQFVENMCASFQKNIGDILSSKLEIVLDKLLNDKVKISSISVVGGVANNDYIKSKLQNITKKNNLKIFFPIKEMISDNAAMIAWACIQKFDHSLIDLNFKANPRLTIGKILQ